MAKIVISVPDTGDRSDVCDYVRTVADQIEDDYTSGHVDHETYWDIEGDPAWD